MILCLSPHSLTATRDVYKGEEAKCKVIKCVMIYFTFKLLKYCKINQEFGNQIVAIGNGCLQ